MELKDLSCPEQLARLDERHRFKRRYPDDGAPKNIPARVTGDESDASSLSSIGQRKKGNH